MWSRIVIVCAFGLTSAAGQCAETILVGNSALIDNRSIILGPVSPHTDSVFVNSQLLSSPANYSIEYASGRVLFSENVVSPTDTVRILWMPASKIAGTVVGRNIPTEGSIRQIFHQPSVQNGVGALSRKLSDDGSLTISGAKSFRMSGGNGSVESSFGQTLDVSISGNLSRLVSIEGIISDRPDVGGYGTLNSRINEIDRLRLSLKSPHLRMDVGDIFHSKIAPIATTPRRVSGVSGKFANKGWSVSSTVARSKGEITTARITTQDGIAGPYRISGRTPSQTIVPHSETVWLDGRQLRRGVSEDYTMDYSGGTLTFTPRVIVDSRCRIEIDFESAQSTYRRNLLDGSLGWMRPDSSVYSTISFTDDRDDRNELLFGEVDALLREQFASVGDFASGVRRSTVVDDTLGSFNLLSDSLPDTVLVFVGKGNGTISAQFTYVGEKSGRYKYAGNGEYTYVGIQVGDYDPISILQPARGISGLAVAFGGRTSMLGKVGVQAKQSRQDKNLYSNIGDDDNVGHLVEVFQNQEWSNGRNTGVISIGAAFREKRFRSSDRTIEADDYYRSFLPASFDTLADQYRGTSDIRIPVNPELALLSGVAVTSAGGYFDSYRAKAGFDWQVTSHIHSAYTYEKLSTRSVREELIPDARCFTHALNAMTSLTDSIQFGVSVKNEVRKTVKSDTTHGSDLFQSRISVTGYSVSLFAERTTVDSLAIEWNRSRTTWRAGGDVRRRWGHLNCAAVAAWQRIADTNSSRESVGMQSNLDYRDYGRKLVASYDVSVGDEQRQERGIAWLDVGNGLGGYRLENGEYIADPLGQFIQVEEILSGQARVRRVDRSMRFSRDWTSIGIAANSRVAEELVTENVWSFNWLSPVAIDNNTPRQFLDRTYDLSMRALPSNKVYRITLKGADGRQSRSISGSERRRDDRRVSVTLKQPIGPFVLEEEGERFRVATQSWYIGGNADGYQLGASLRRFESGSDYSLTVRYRRAEGDGSSLSRIGSVLSAAHIRKPKVGDIRLEFEIYTQSLSTSSVSYSLSDGHLGKLGVQWSIDAHAGVSKSLRLSLRVSGRHADTYRARVQARSEIVASF